MKPEFPLPRRQVRSVFVSDIHLGYQQSRPNAFADFLGSISPQFLYLAGDILDGWRMSKNLILDRCFINVVHSLYELIGNGTLVRYTVGNHDNGLKHFDSQFPGIEVCERCLHVAADGRRYVVLHGDQFDRFEKNAQWLSQLACFLGGAFSARKRKRISITKTSRSDFSTRAKQTYNSFLKVKNFDSQIVECADSRRADGVICGHFHFPEIRHIENKIYCNTGDWLTNCSALFEYYDGTLELMNLDQMQGNCPGLHQRASSQELEEIDQLSNVSLSNSQNPLGV